MITIKRGDTGVGLKANLSNENGSVDLTDADVLFFMDKHRIYPNITDAVNGQVSVALESTHTKETGVFFAEFQVTFPDGRVETFPNDGYIKVKIMRDLGGN